MRCVDLAELHTLTPDGASVCVLVYSPSAHARLGVARVQHTRNNFLINLHSLPNEYWGRSARSQQIGGSGAAASTDCSANTDRRSVGKIDEMGGQNYFCEFFVSLGFAES